MKKNDKNQFIKNIHDALPKSLSAADKEYLQNFTDNFLLYLTDKDVDYIETEKFAARIHNYWQLCSKAKNLDNPIIEVTNYPEISPHGVDKQRYRTSFFFAIPDTRFLVGTMLSSMRMNNLDPHISLHSVMQPKDINVSYNRNISCIYMETNRISDPMQIDAIKEDLLENINNLRLATSDYGVMKEKMQTIATNYQQNSDKFSKEITDFMNWLVDGNYIAFGYRELDYSGTKNKLSYQVKKDSPLGILKNPEVVISHYRTEGEIMSEQFQHFANGKRNLKVRKSSINSTLHRKSGYDLIRIKRYDNASNILGEYEICGLFSSKYYATPVMDIPILRENARVMFESLAIEQSSYSTGLFYHVLNNYPRDDLWAEDTAHLTDDIAAVIEAETCVHSRLTVFVDPYGYFISTNLYMPIDVYSTALVSKVVTELEKSLNATIRERYFYTGDSPLVRINMIFNTTPGNVPKFSKKDLEKKIVALSVPWYEKLEEALFKEYKEHEAQNLYMCYMHAFPLSYTGGHAMERTIADIPMIEKAMIDDDSCDIEIYSTSVGKNKLWHLRMVQVGDVSLSDILPKLESTGVKVGEANHYVISPLGSPEVTLYDFKLEFQQEIDSTVLTTEFPKTFREIWADRAAVDEFNSLTLYSNLNYREILLFRAITAYFKQGKLPFSAQRIYECLKTYPEITHLLVKYFHARFDPANHSERGAKLVYGKIIKELELVKTLEEDKIFRTHLIFIDAMMRTNYYQPAQDSANAIISFKLASRKLEFLPEPRPFREIYVYSERFEAVHLRFGYVARGGLRWSDRHEDFRTEILGLVKAQQVKNAVIVPVGSKGGFILKTPQPDREAFMKEGIACYKSFIKAMLNITDNLQNGKAVHPENLLCHDGDDSYLVVAADKGTATFSDIANEIAVDHGFWLGDAFASGGSAGYDHKKMGITARGAWECVKRHFREIDVNIQETPFSVVGIGDMSGDVFGNGMLLSKQIKLIAAFNHMHIFIDPDPDPAKSWQERKRLFDMPRSAWSDYDTKIMSKGGQIYDRSAKEIKLTPEIQTLLNLTKNTLSPNELLRELLKSNTDLLWFGGIGTYIKSSNESHLDVGDKASDDIRIDAGEVRAKVIGEGANLGMTHQSRIEYAVGGGRCNTDAVDNSAGVDCSDHEVNLKILLTQAINDNKLKVDDRNKLLESMTDDIARLVLENNYKQSATLTMILTQGVNFIDQQQQLMRNLVDSGQLNRGLEFLPRDVEIEKRRENHMGLNRPELCVLLAYAKNVAYQELLETSLPDDPFYVDFLYNYFPQKMTDMFGNMLEKHQLKREIIATILTNQVINCTGPSFIDSMKSRTGAEISEIINAFSLVYQIFDMASLRSQIEALDNKINSSLQTAMLFETYRTFDRIVEWFITHEKAPFDLKALNKKYGEPIIEMEKNLKNMLPPDTKENHLARITKFAQDGVPTKLAEKIGGLKILSTVCEITKLAEKSKQDTQRVAEYYFYLSERFSIDWLRTQINLIAKSADKWEHKALIAIADDLWQFQSQLTHFVITRYKHDNLKDTMKSFVDDHKKSLVMLDNLLMDCHNQSLTLALLTVVTREKKKLLLMHQ